MKKIISLVLILSLLMSTTNVALPFIAYAENENADEAVDNADVWAIENSIDKEETSNEEMIDFYLLEEQRISLMSYGDAEISGKITDENGNAIEGVSVSVYDMTEHIFIDLYYTNSSGTWKFGDAISGDTYSIRYYHPLYEIADNTIEVTADSSTAFVPDVTATKIYDEFTETDSSKFTYSVINGLYIKITGYTGADNTVVIPKTIDGYTVQSINDNVFKNNNALVTVVFPDSLESIGSSCFYNCTNLTTVVFNSALKTIGSSAFEACTNLAEVRFPNGLQTIGSYAFERTKLSSVELPDGLLTINGSAFTGCTELESFDYPIGWMTSGSNIFYNCPKLTKITVPEGVIKTPDSAFNGMSQLTEISLPTTLIELGSSTFKSCTGLTKIEIPANVTAIGSSAFEYCTGLKKISLPDGLLNIKSYAFEGCTALTEIELPNSITTINGGAFTGCTNLSSWNYPTSLTTTGSNILYNCTKIEEIVIPEGVTKIPANAFSNANKLLRVSLPTTLTEIGNEAFKSCVGLTDVEIPANVTAIGSSAFEYCTGLKKISLPDGLLNIKSYAFEGCTALTEVELPNSITTIGSGAFSGCTNLRNVNYPSNLTTTSANIWYNCSKLTSITVPEGVTTIPTSAFEGANSLRTVHLPTTLTTINNYAFENCARLYYITIPTSVTKIGNYVFSGCSKLRQMFLPNNDIAFGNNIFEGCNKLTVECEEYSFATIYCINSGIPVEFIGGEFVDNSNLVFDRANTYYVANTVGALANGYVTMNVAYGYKDIAENQITNQKLSLYIPSDMTLIEKTLKLDGTLLTGYEYEDNILTTSLTNKSGNISFCLKPTGDSTVTTYAIMDFKQNGTAEREVLGIINEDIPLISLLANDEVDTADVAVNGVGPADTDIKLYIDGKLATTVHSNKTGGYNTKVTIPNPSNYTSYTITAKAADDDGAEISASKAVVYSSGASVIQSFTMNYQDNTYDVLELGNTKPTVTFTAGSQFGFNVKFSNTEKVEDVYICSTRSNVTKRIKAEWNEATQSYTAKGLFDPSNTSYVPGTITVQYSQVKDKLSFANGIDYSSEKYVNGASEPIKAMLKGKLDDCIEDLVSTNNTLSGVIKMIDVDSQMDFNILTDVIPSWLDPSSAGQYGYEVMEDDYGAKLYLKVAEYGEDKVRGEILDFAKGKVTDFLIEGKYISAVEGIESYFSFVEVLGYADTMLTWDNNRVSINEARQSVLASSMSEAEKAQALQKLEYASKANGGTIACMALGIVLTAAGITLPFPMGLVLPLLSMQNSNYVDDVLGQFGFLDASETDGVMFNFRWKIDPSGYVYDAYTNERLQGVTTTAYWIEYDPNDATFWDNTPADTEYGTLWDASEWDQINPLITDTEGRYSWDVPEGWWRVKYEKTGYETVWSHWMTVPPVQTDVNIGMMATEKPDKYITYNNSTKTVTVTSNVAYSNASVYIAAYQGGKLISLKSQPKDIAIGETPVVFSDFDSTGADTVKVMVWESTSNIKPLFNTCVVKLK